MKTLVTGILIVFSTVLHAQIITTIAGNGNTGLSGEGGLAVNASFAGADGITVDKFGNIYFTDWLDGVVEKIDTNGILTRFAGTGATYVSGYNGTPATSTPIGLNDFSGVVADSIGNVYFDESSVVRMVNTAGIITTIAGSTSTGYSGDGGPATLAELDAPIGLCFDKNDNLYIADAFNSDIRKVNTIGFISTFAGTTIGFGGDGGPATNAKFLDPQGITFDNSGNLYIADATNSRIRKVDTSGIITTIAGGDDTSMSALTICWGCPAIGMNLYSAVGVTADKNGNIYTSLISFNVVEKITPAGLAYTIAGTGAEGYSGDGGPAVEAELNAPKMICMDNAGNLLIGDAGNSRIRKVWLNPTSIPHIQSGSLRFSVYPNPVTNHYLTCTITADTYDVATIAIRDILGQEVFRSRCLTNNATGFTIDVPPGLYFITAYATSGTIVEKLVVE